MLTHAQDKLYWRVWAAALRACSSCLAIIDSVSPVQVAWTRAALRARPGLVRRELHGEASELWPQGLPESHTGWGNEHLDEWIARCKAVSEGGNYRAQRRQAQMPQTRWLHAIQEVLEAMGRGMEYAEGIARQMNLYGALGGALSTLETLAPEKQRKVYLSLKTETRRIWPRKEDLLDAIYAAQGETGCEADVVCAAVAKALNVEAMPMIEGLVYEKLLVVLAALRRCAKREDKEVQKREIFSNNQPAHGAAGLTDIQRGVALVFQEPDVFRGRRYAEFRDFGGERHRLASGANGGDPAAQRAAGSDDYRERGVGEVRAALRPDGDVFLHRSALHGVRGYGVCGVDECGCDASAGDAGDGERALDRDAEQCAGGARDFPRLQADERGEAAGDQQPGRPEEAVSGADYPAAGVGLFRGKVAIGSGVCVVEVAVDFARCQEALGGAEDHEAIDALEGELGVAAAGLGEVVAVALHGLRDLLAIQPSARFFFCFLPAHGAGISYRGAMELGILGGMQDRCTSHASSSQKIVTSPHEARRLLRVPPAAPSFSFHGESWLFTAFPGSLTVCRHPYLPRTLPLSHSPTLPLSHSPTPLPRLLPRALLYLPHHQLDPVHVPACRGCL